MDLEDEFAYLEIDIERVKVSLDELKSIAENFVEDDTSYRKLNDRSVFISTSIAKIMNDINAALREDFSKANEIILTNTNVCDEILDTFLRLISKLIKINNISIEYVCELPKAVGIILLQVFLHCKESESLYASSAGDLSLVIMNIFKKSHMLQVEYLKLLSESIIFDNGNSTHDRYLREVFSILLEIGEVVIALDVKTTAEQWKYFTRLCELHTDCIRECSDILEKVTIFFCDQISSSLKKLATKEITDQKNVNRTLKLSNFLLKIFHKLISTTGDSMLMNPAPVFHLLVVIHEYSLPHLRLFELPNNLIEGIRSHISIGLDIIINSIISNGQFTKVFFSEIKSLIATKCNVYGCISLAINIMKNLLPKDETVKQFWVDPYKDHIVVVILDMIHLCSEELMNYYELECEIGKITLYEHLLIHTAAFVISLPDIAFVDEKIFRLLCRDDLITAIFVLDLMVIIARFSSADYCMSQVQFYSSLIMQLHDIPQTTFFNILLHKLFSMLPLKMKNQLLEKYPVTDYLYLWTLIGLEWVTSEKTTVLNETIDHSCNCVDRFINKENSSPKSYKNMMLSLEVVSTIDFSLLSYDKSSNIVKRLSKLWDLIVFKDISSRICSTWFIHHISSLCKITSRLADQVSTENWIKILKALHAHMENCPTELNFLILDLLECFKYIKYEDSNFENVLIPLVGDVYGKLLESENTVFKLAAMENFQSFSKATCNESVIRIAVSKNPATKQLIKDYFSKKYPHHDEKFQFIEDKKCLKNANSEDNNICPPKRMKLQVSADENKLDKVMMEILKLISELKVMCTNRSLNEDQIKTIKMLKTKLSEIE